jgi:CO/xanthine dehydrogenase FAD-binding subunit
MPLALKSFPAASDAAAALKGAGTRYMGGGTLVVRAANEGDLSFDTIVRATDPALADIRIEGERVTLGASATMARIARHADLGELSRVARSIGGPAVRTMASVGGNLFAASPYGDFAVALLALDATVHTTQGEMPIDAFIAGRDGFAGIVTAMSFDRSALLGLQFVKVSRIKPKGVSVLSIAAVLDEDENGRITSARIALGCMADRPIRARPAERALAGAERMTDGIAAAVAAIGDGIDPPTDAIASAWYRAEVLPVHFRRLLLG